MDMLEARPLVGASADVPHYVAQGQECALFEQAWRSQLPLLIKGPTGCGKTRFVEHMAARLGRPLVTVSCHDDLSASDLVGRHLIGQGSTVWQDGPLARAVRQGAICYLDEVVEARKDTTVVIHPLADDRRALPIERTGEVLIAPPEFMLVVSYNPGYQNLLKALKPSTRQRFVALTFAYPEAGVEQAIVRSESGVRDDVAAGLVGAITVSRRGQANADGTPKDVDREIFALFAGFNENQSWYADENVAAHISAADQQKLNKRDNVPNDLHMYVAFTGKGFAETNFKFSVNGYLYGNGPVMTMRAGQRVRWYLMDVGDVVNFHTPHWLGHLVTYHNKRTDVFAMLPAGMETADMMPDAAGKFVLRCQVDDHMQAGMWTRYEVLPAAGITGLAATFCRKVTGREVTAVGLK